ncbi:PD-(D/E)XK nuclease family protein [Hymenobacter sp. UV11]|uniref:PD-(D/E)XK nuclease family protein n=1 Tax=Hymenobacter sp. UV11 TaxID=1849735 RepID=UPI00105D7A2D|nr:PD-(D/E)XK nuclease family protein [Hymenobacter sp. UV11]TFZ64528.1 PD-(D/E)XK nuclease family protein [Hymenobacter sp. UV11]
MLPSPTLAAPLTSAPAPTPSFLAEVAAELLATHDADALADLVVIVPTRRAVVYLKNELALATPLGQALWAPRIAAMEDYIIERAGVQVEEPIALQLRLFDIFKEIDPELRFDHFVGWGGLLLQDFSSLDQNLTDTKGVFAYLAEAKALERWQLDPELKTTGLDRYFGFWGQLHRVYLRFKKLLKKDHLAYPGLAYRRAVQHLRAELADPKRALPPLHYFVGLGGLSKAEETFIDRLHRVGRAELRFDADPFYLDADSPNRAGQALRRYWQKWDLPRDTYTRQEHLRERPHHVRLLGVANASMQGKLAGQLLAEARQLNPQATVAVVLPDETLLLPVLHGLPPAELVPDFNVTMGLSFQSTALFNLVDLLFEVHLTGIREGAEGTDFGVPKYHHQAVTKLLAHPFLRRYQQWLDAQADAPQFHNLLDNICRQIVQRHLVLLPAPTLLKLGLGHPLIEALFRPWNNCDNIIRACYVLIDLLKQVYLHEHGAIEAEYLYLFYTLVRQLDSAFDCREQRLSVRSFRRFLYEQMRGTRLPFAGEPLAQVQIMGLLETRALDFDHVIILSCNENALPAPKRQTSLFPYDVLAEFKLPTYADAEATAAYNFWRLLQRAGRVDLVHVLPGAEGVRTGERSRFLRQLEFDLAPQNSQLALEDRTVEVVTPSALTSPPSPLSRGEGGLVSTSSLELEASSASPRERGLGGEVSAEGALLGDLTLAKDGPMLAGLRGVLERGLSPSALNEYLACSLKFYFSRLARFQENEEVEEALGADGFGTVVHDALEMLLKPFELEQRELTAADLPAILQRVPAEVTRQLRQEEADRQARPDDGLNHVLGQVATRLIRKYLESLPGQPGVLPLRIVGQEKPMAATVFADLPGEAAPLAVRLFGRADRIDALPDGRRRVVDYKTGLVERRELNLRGTQKPLPPAETIEKLLNESSSGADKVRQLWLYRFMLESDELNPAPPGSEAAIMSLRKIDEGLLSAPLDFITEGTGEPDFLRASAELVGRLARRILDPAEPIRKTDDLAKCEYCPYRGICAR